MASDVAENISSSCAFSSLTVSHVYILFEKRINLVVRKVQVGDLFGRHELDKYLHALVCEAVVLKVERAEVLEILHALQDCVQLGVVQPAVVDGEGVQAFAGAQP